ncbi:MAG: hypothetical protein CBD16_09475 [Betaproteobacteria bacterium TMED156]|nr:MAG: hypothetical protein CBD16_09475 [Betaproteobacteria bacterium TMED156]
MNIIYIAQFHETCGYSHAAHGYLKSLDSDLNLEDINLKTLSFSMDPGKLDQAQYSSKIEKETLNLIDKYHFNEQEELDEFLSSEYICVWHMTSVCPIIMNKPNVGRYYKNLNCNIQKIILGSKENYHILAWETDKLSKEYKEVIKNYQTKYVLAPSEWNKICFSESFKSKLLPHLIELEPKSKEVINLPNCENKFVILSVSEWTNRKNFQCLIRSFLLEFSDVEEAVLVLKTSLPFGMSKQVFLEQLSHIRSSVRTYKKKKQNIIVILDYLSQEKINYLFERCDAFCLTSLGEGFSLPTSMAAAAGKPVICPRYGGHVDYIDPDNKYFIDGVWDNVFDNPPYECDGLWFLPTIKSTKDKMRLAFDDWRLNKLQEEGVKNLKTIKQGKFSKKYIANTFAELIEKDKKLKIESKIESLKRSIQNRSLQSSLDLLKDKYKGEDCYILNCGPSLNDHDEEKLKLFLKDKLTFTVKQAYEKYKEVSDFHFFNCSNLPIRQQFEPHYENKKDTITISSSNYDEFHRWSPMQTSDLFFKIPLRTEINNEFLVRTGEIDKFLIKNSLTRPCGPGIMYETVLFMAIHLGVKSITVLGWDLTMEKVTKHNYKHFYGSSDGLTNRGDILDWEIEETRNFSKDFFEWCVKNSISLSLVSEQSSLFNKIPRKKLEL